MEFSVQNPQQLLKNTVPNQVEEKIEKYQGTLPNFDKLTQDILLQTAKTFAWPLGTPEEKRNYKTGSRTKKFDEALYKVFPKYKGQKEPYKQGASCSVFVCTVIRFIGLDTKIIPSKELEYLQNKTLLWEKQNQKSAQAGDVFFYWHNKAENSYHTLIYGGKVGSKYLWYQANANKQYPYAFYGKAPTNSYYNKAYIYRPKKAVRYYIERGDVGIQPKLMQQFLNWFGNYKLKEDGDVGEKTENAIKDFQIKQGLVVDGKFGMACLEKAKTIEK